MSKKNESRPRSKPTGDAKSEKAAAPAPVQDGFRETVESIVIAFVLAFLFRTFEAEAFVIPTGSMAPTLMGQHKDTKCSRCGFPFRVSASQEEPQEHVTDPIDREVHYKQFRVVAFKCPNCRYQMRFGEGSPDGEEPPPSYKGDRILVGKLSYEVGDPERWDVAVFKYPESAKVNFIKRVAGLPDETVVVWHGDIFTASGDLGERLVDVRAAKDLTTHGTSLLEARDAASLRQEGKLSIARKPPHKVQAILQAVYDNNYPLPDPWSSVFPPRWSPDSEAADPVWKTLEGGKAFQCNGEQDRDSWLVYRHLAPSANEWGQALRANGAGGPVGVQPRLIADFYGYNTAVPARVAPKKIKPDQFLPDDSGSDRNWVGDLSLRCRLQPQSEQGEALLTLVEGGCLFSCRIDLADGQASFSISQDPSFKISASTPVRGPGSFEVEFANVDDQLFLWVNGKTIEFDGRYGPLNNYAPTVDDLTPARVGSRGAEIQISDLLLRRDVYYTDPEYDDGPAPFGSINFFSNPEEWGVFSRRPAVAFVLRPDEYLMLGDNSPQSKDSRLWDGSDADGRTEYYVNRDLMIGKALYIYWPHALDHLPRTDIWFPLFPNFGRMGFVR